MPNLSKVMTDFKDKYFRFKFGSKRQLAFLEDLHTLINDGIPANRAIEMIAQSSTGINRRVAYSIANKIGEGQPMAEGMREWFAPNVVEIIRVGESGGALAQTIKSGINALSRQGLAMGAFIGAVSYPLFVIMIACSVIVYLNGQVFTQFRMIKPEESWPDEGRRLVGIANFVTGYWWTVVLGVIVIVVIFRWLMANYAGELRPILDRYPPFSFYRRLVAARLLETLGLLVSNGVVFRAAIKVMQLQANPYTLSHLQQMERLLSTGKSNIGDVLNTGLIDAQDLMRLRVMAEVKGFEHGLIRMGILGADQVAATLKLISKIIGGLFLAVGGILIIVIIQGIYLTGMAMGET